MVKNRSKNSLVTHSPVYSYTIYNIQYTQLIPTAGLAYPVWFEPSTCYAKNVTGLIWARSFFFDEYFTQYPIFFII